MDKRSNKSIVTFPFSFRLFGHPGELPAGDYDVLVEEELLEEFGFSEYRRTVTYLTVPGGGCASGRTKLRPIVEADQETAVGNCRKSDT